MSRKIQWVCAVVLVLVLGIITGSYFSARSNEVVTYKVDVIGEDLILRNFTLVTFKNKYYITSDTRVEKRSSSNSELNNCFIEISQDNEVLVNSSFIFRDEKIIMKDTRLGVDYYEYFGDKLSSTKEKISKDKEIQVKFNYTIDGVEKEDIQIVKLNKFIYQKI